MKKFTGTISRVLQGTVFLFVVLSILGSCEKTPDNVGNDPGGSNGPATNEVFIQDMSYTPATITVTANTTIKWTNKDAVAHTVTSDNGLFDSGSISTGGTYVFTFTTSGTFAYHCTPHPSMTASVKVN